MKTVLQSESSECGMACLTMIANHFGYHADLSELRRRFPISMKGATLNQLIRHAAALQLSSRPLRLELDELSMLQLPCILHWDLNHFVVLHEIKTNFRGLVTLTVLDPAIGVRKITLQESSKHFTGVALELTPTASFEQKTAPPTISLKILTGKVIGLRRALLQIFFLAIALEVFALVSPLFNQFIIDDVIISGDRELLLLLTTGFAILIVTQTAISLARSWFLMRWSIQIGTQWTVRLFTHLVSLPVYFFEKRHLSDIVSRFSSINSIQSTLTSLFVESLLDGLMAILALGMMVIYSPALTAVVMLGSISYILIRWSFYYPLREASQERLILSAKENGHFLETIRAITPLKLFGRETERISHWQNLRQDVINRDVKTQKISIFFKVANTTISATQGMALFYIGSGQVMSNQLSVGMLMAFSSYSATFSSRVFNLVDAFVSLKMLTLHSERLADIVLEKPEINTHFEVDLNYIEPQVTVKNLKFRYSDGEPWIINGANFQINAGDSIALVGASGCGKTTLCKILLGLLPPTEGEILIDKTPINQIGHRNLRSIIGTVMQDDVLLSGSILDNIAFFDSDVDQNQVERCALLASVHDEIVAMPMRYQTLVGDLGNSLSGGQRQRILLARALYKNPKILALDEATSHLDVKNERKVNDALKKLKVTRIVVAHRPETIRSADKIFTVAEGQVRQVITQEAA